MTQTYRTNDPARWGTGQGFNLSPAQVDNNFWDLIQRMIAQELRPDPSAGIAYFSISGTMMYVHMTDGTILGPYELPVVMFLDRGVWAPSTVYSKMDTFSINGGLYVVVFDHTSGTTFDPGANDGAGHNYYQLMIQTPGSSLPSGGAVGQLLKKTTTADYAVGWGDDLTITPSNLTPGMDGTAAAGTSALYSRGDHIHPSDTTKAPLASPTFTGTPAAPTASSGANTTQIATTAFVAAAISAGGTFVDAPSDGSCYGRLNAGWAKVAPLNSAVLTGTPAAPTATPGTSTTQLATTAFVAAAVSGSGGVTPAALTRISDTNVTLTLGGTPATALLQATSITVGWTGTLGAARGGFGADVSASNGVPLFAAGAATFTGTTGTGNFVRAADPALTGNPTAPTVSPGTDSTTKIATTAFVQSAVSAAGGVAPSGSNPIMDGAAAPGVSALYSRGDHVHPSDTTRAPLASPTFTGSPAAPTQAANDNSTKLATTAFVQAAIPTGNIPQNSQSGAYTTVLADAEKHIFHPAADTTARTWTIDSNANVGYPIGTAITFVNQNAAGAITISITADTMRLAGAGTTGSRTLAANGVATALKVTSTEWIISGTGLT